MLETFFDISEPSTRALGPLESIRKKLKKLKILIFVMIFFGIQELDGRLRSVISMLWGYSYGQNGRSQCSDGVVGSSAA